VARPLPFDADRRAAERRDDESEEHRRISHVQVPV
jgi:hypothetical protein